MDGARSVGHTPQDRIVCIGADLKVGSYTSVLRGFRGLDLRAEQRRLDGALTGAKHETTLAIDVEPGAIAITSGHEDLGLKSFDEARA